VYLSVVIFEMVFIYCDYSTEHTKTRCGQYAGVLVLNLVVHIVASRLQTVKRTVWKSIKSVRLITSVTLTLWLN